MKSTIVACVLATAIGGFATRTTSAETWDTADKFSLQDGLSATATDVGTGSDGTTIFSVGTAASDNTGNESAIVRRSTNAGATWTTVDAFADPNWKSALYRAIATGANGTVFAAGNLWDPVTLTKTWIVRESSDAGSTWATSDVFFQGATGKPSCGDIKVNPYTGDVYAVGVSNINSNSGFMWAVRKRAAGAANFVASETVGTPPSNNARAVGFHPTGGVFVVGSMGDSQRPIWTVRRSTNGGVTWSTVDSFQDSTKTYSEAYGITVSPSGAIYVSGRAAQTVKGKTINNWVIRRSLNGGTTWTTVDRFGGEPAPYGIGDSTAKGITVAPSGAVFVTGVFGDPSHFIVRKGTTAANGTMSWTTVDDYQLTTGQPADGQGITADAAGNIFVSGVGQVDSTGAHLFLTRKLNGPQ